MQLQTQSLTRSGTSLFAHSAGALRVMHCLGVGQPVPRAVLVFSSVTIQWRELAIFLTSATSNDVAGCIYNIREASAI